MIIGGPALPIKLRPILQSPACNYTGYWVDTSFDFELLNGEGEYMIKTNTTASGVKSFYPMHFFVEDPSTIYLNQRDISVYKVECLPL